MPRATTAAQQQQPSTPDWKHSVHAYRRTCEGQRLLERHQFASPFPLWSLDYGQSAGNAAQSSSVGSPTNNQHKLLGYMQPALQRGGSFAEPQRPMTTSNYLSQSGPYDRDHSTEVRKAGINLDFPGRDMHQAWTILHFRVIARWDGVHGSLSETTRAALFTVYDESSTGLYITRSTFGPPCARYLSKWIHAQVGWMRKNVTMSMIDYSFAFQLCFSWFNENWKVPVASLAVNRTPISFSPSEFLWHINPDHSTRASNRSISQSLFFK